MYSLQLTFGLKDAEHELCYYWLSLFKRLTGGPIVSAFIHLPGEFSSMDIPFE